MGEGADGGQAGGVFSFQGIPAGLVGREGFSEGGIGGDVGVELFQGGRGVDFVARLGGDVEDGDLLLQGVGIEVEYPCAGLRLALGWYPRDVAVGDEDDVGGGDAIVDAVSEA